MIELEKLYVGRFSPAELAAKKRVWQVLCRHFFQRYVRSGDAVLDLGAGGCEFINNIVAERRIAVDLNPETPTYAAAGVEVLTEAATELDAVADGSVDVVFASNFFEHLPDSATFLKTLSEVRRMLRAGGLLLVLQPNIALLGGRYWDFLDHHLPLTEKTVCEALSVLDFRVVELRRRFLPYTSKGRLPAHPMLVRLYLALPLAHRLLGGQSWIVAERGPDDRRLSTRGEQLTAHGSPGGGSR